MISTEARGRSLFEKIVIDMGTKIGGISCSFYVINFQGYNNISGLV